MGMDFSALLKYETPGDLSDDRVAAIESQSPTDVKAVAGLWLSKGLGEEPLNRAGWISSTEFPEPAQKPEAPTLDYAFRTGEAFYLTFGKDAVWVYHLLRWHTFLSDPDWQEQMTLACRAIARLLNATDGILTRDESPVILGFLAGMSFDQAVDQGSGEEGEVLSLSDMRDHVDDVCTWNSHGYWYFLRANQADDLGAGPDT